MMVIKMYYGFEFSLMLGQEPPGGAIFIGIVLLVGLAAGALFFFRSYERLAERSLARKFADLKQPFVVQPGDVIFTYHTYHGFLAWFTQTPHQVSLPPEEARELLGRLLRFNLTWGLVTPGMIFIVPLSLLNYAAQRKSITSQEREGGVVESSMESVKPDVDSD